MNTLTVKTTDIFNSDGSLNNDFKIQCTLRAWAEKNAWVTSLISKKIKGYYFNVKHKTEEFNLKNTIKIEAEEKATNKEDLVYKNSLIWLYENITNKKGFSAGAGITRYNWHHNDKNGKNYYIHIGVEFRNCKESVLSKESDTNNDRPRVILNIKKHTSGKAKAVNIKKILYLDDTKEIFSIDKLNKEIVDFFGKKYLARKLYNALEIDKKYY